jgi:hypothetical protein
MRTLQPLPLQMWPNHSPVVRLNIQRELHRVRSAYRPCETRDPRCAAADLDIANAEYDISQ